MGRRRQEQVTGKTYEERVKAAQKFSVHKFLKNVFRLNKKPPENYANIRRDGQVEVNPRLKWKEEP